MATMPGCEDVFYISVFSLEQVLAHRKLHEVSALKCVCVCSLLCAQKFVLGLLVKSRPGRRDCGEGGGGWPGWLGLALLSHPSSS